MVHSAGTPMVVSTTGLLLIIIVLIIVPIVIGVVDYLKVKKQKKTFNCITICGYQPLSINGQAKREPLHDFFPRSSGSAYFCNSVSLTIKNEGNLPVDTDALGQPVAFSLGINGKLDVDLEDIKIKPSNKQLTVTVEEGRLILNHVFSSQDYL